MHLDSLLGRDSLPEHNLASDHEDMRVKYQELPTEKLNNAGDKVIGDCEWCWSALKVSMLSVTDEVVGYGGRAQPDWLRGSLTPLIDAKNAYRRRLLENNTLSTIGRIFVNVSVVSRLLLHDKVREDWILKLHGFLGRIIDKQGKCTCLEGVLLSLYFGVVVGR